MLDFSQGSLGTFLKEKLQDFQPEMISYEYGTVFSCADGIVRISGLSHAQYGELLRFENDVYGIALDTSLEGVGAALLSRGASVRPGSRVQGTGRVADIGVGKELLGRVVDPIGRPLDGHPLTVRAYRQVESPAPAIMDRSPVDTPMETGILAVDSMIPIGRGQRELIIGDRQTGKTSIALSAMMNQKDTGVICVYCAIGQKAASVANLVRTLEESGTLSHTVVVASTAADSAAMQYLAPYAACAVAEGFMYQGQDVLVVYDDLSKHAGGSMTALPIVETMAGDISAYIPTNVISITDGQIYLESELFHSGVRPAVNVGLSVSRVGRSAQYDAMKAVSGSLRLEVAQYRDMAVFAQFGADVDVSTKKLLDRGLRMTELLKQSKDRILKLSEQVVILTALHSEILETVEVASVRKFVQELLAWLKENHPDILGSIDTTKSLPETTANDLKKAMAEFAAQREA